MSLDRRLVSANRSRWEPLEDSLRSELGYDGDLVLQLEEQAAVIGSVPCRSQATELVGEVLPTLGGLRMKRANIRIARQQLVTKAFSRAEPRADRSALVADALAERREAGADKVLGQGELASGDAQKMLASTCGRGQHQA
jgi:hypothetical protein